MADDKNGTVAGSALLGDILEALIHGGLAAGGTAFIMNALQKHGAPDHVIERVRNAFQIRFGGLGTQDEINNEGGLLTLYLLTSAEINNLVPGSNIDGIEAHNRVTSWLASLTSTQRRKFIVIAGGKFSDTYSSMKADEKSLADKQATLQAAKRELAYTYIPLALCGPAGNPNADAARTQIAIAQRWIIPAEDDHVHKAGEWLKKTGKNVVNEWKSFATDDDLLWSSVEAKLKKERAQNARYAEAQRALSYPTNQADLNNFNNMKTQRTANINAIAKGQALPFPNLTAQFQTFSQLVLNR